MTATDCGWMRIWIPVRSIEETASETGLWMPKITYGYVCTVSMPGISAEYKYMWFKALCVCYLNVLANFIMFSNANKSVKVRPHLLFCSKSIAIHTRISFKVSVWCSNWSRGFTTLINRKLIGLKVISVWAVLHASLHFL